MARVCGGGGRVRILEENAKIVERLELIDYALMLAQLLEIFK